MSVYFLIISSFNLNVLSHKYSKSFIALSYESIPSFDISDMFHSIFFSNANLVIFEDPTIISNESSYSNKYPLE